MYMRGKKTRNRGGNAMTDNGGIEDRKGIRSTGEKGGGHEDEKVTKYEIRKKQESRIITEKNCQLF
jgi:hypothetical protein